MEAGTQMAVPYSLGVMMFEMLARSYPSEYWIFGGGTSLSFSFYALFLLQPPRLKLPLSGGFGDELSG